MVKGFLLERTHLSELLHHSIGSYLHGDSIFIA